MGLGALAKGFTDGFRTAQDTRFRREDAEYKKYERDRKKKEDEQFDAGKNAALEELGKEDGGIDVGGTLGLRAPSTFRPAVQGKPGESAMDNTAAGLVGPNAPQIETPGAGLQLQRGAQYGQDKAMLRRLAGMARDPAQLEALMKSARQLKIDSDVAAISERVMSATPEEAARWADMVSADKRNGFKAKPDPKNPGLMLVEEGGTKLTLDRSQMAKFLAANHRLKLGDRTAMADLEAFDKDLAARINETYTRARNDSADARENFKALDTANYHKGALANDSARVGIARDSASAARMGQVQYFEDPQTKEVKAYIPSSGKGGLGWTEVNVPTGMRPYNRGGKQEAEFEKLPEDGTKVKDRTGNVLTYTEGVPLLQGGVPPSQQAVFYTKAGLPPQAETALQWMPGGRHVRIAGDDTVYDAASRSDMAQLKAVLDRMATRSIEGTEALSRGQGIADPRDAAARRGPTYIDRFAVPSPLERAYGLTPRN